MDKKEKFQDKENEKKKSEKLTNENKTNDNKIVYRDFIVDENGYFLFYKR